MIDSISEWSGKLVCWLVLVFISLAMFGNYYVYDCIGPLAPLLSREGFSDASIGLLQAIYSFPNIVMVLVGGIIPDVDIPKLKEMGVKGVFLPGTPMQEIIDFINANARARV